MSYQSPPTACQHPITGQVCGGGVRGEQVLRLRRLLVSDPAHMPRPQGPAHRVPPTGPRPLSQKDDSKRESMRVCLMMLPCHEDLSHGDDDIFSLLGPYCLCGWCVCAPGVCVRMVCVRMVCVYGVCVCMVLLQQ